MSILNRALQLSSLGEPTYFDGVRPAHLGAARFVYAVSFW